MSAITSALGCSLMMVLALAAFAWYAGTSGKSRREGDEVDVLRAELAELRQQLAGPSSDELRGRH